MASGGEEAIDRRRTHGEHLPLYSLVEKQVPVPLHSLKEDGHKRLQSFPAEPVGGLPEHDQRILRGTEEYLNYGREPESKDIEQEMAKLAANSGIMYGRAYLTLTHLSGVLKEMSSEDWLVQSSGWSKPKANASYFGYYFWVLGRDGVWHHCWVGFLRSTSALHEENGSVSFVVSRHPFGADETKTFWRSKEKYSFDVVAKETLAFVERLRQS